MNTIEEARKHLRQLTKEYNEAVFSREECRKNMAACVLQHRESVDPIENSPDESLKFAVQAETLAEQHVQNALKQFRSQQVAFDKLKHKAAEVKQQESSKSSERTKKEILNQSQIGKKTHLVRLALEGPRSATSGMKHERVERELLDLTESGGKMRLLIQNPLRGSEM
jgi:hypothetical protein